MTGVGIVQKGVVVLEPTATFPEGTRVTVTSISPLQQPEDEGPTILERYRDIIGIAPELPADMAKNHDHYIHGTPKK